MQYPSLPTIKRLFAVSGNQCAFPKCPLPLVDEASSKVTGKICHIKAQNPGGARYDENQTGEQRHAFENLILMCPIHHDVIDSDEDSYTVERLHQIKAEHEKGNQIKEEPSNETINALIDNSQIITSISSVVNKDGGQMANQIVNFLPQPESATNWGKEIQAKRDAHDLRRFLESDEILNEDKLENLCYWLLSDDSYRTSYLKPVRNFYIFFDRTSNHYLDNNLNNSCLKLTESLKLLAAFLGRNFFFKPTNSDSDDMRFCLYPDLNMDRGGSGELKDSILYEKYADEMVELVGKVREAYKTYRKVIKETHFI